MVKRIGLLSRHQYALAALLLLTVASVTGCGSETAPLTEESLKNAEYRDIGIYPKPVKLDDGKFKGYYVAGGSTRSTVALIEPCAFWDLDGDGLDDAAVLLVEDSGGRGVIFYLAAVLNQNGKPVNVATTRLGDRAHVEDLAIEEGVILVRLVTYGPGDPKCCPSQVLVETYVLEGSKLVPSRG
jgi:hypothetical protein